MLTNNDYEKESLREVDKLINDMLKNLFFNPNGIHGINHTKRVLILLNKIMDSENLSTKDRSILVYSALYHDIGRDSDGVDYSHGVKSYKKLIRTGLLDYLKLEFEDEDIEMLRFIIEQHPINDEAGIKNIKRYYNIIDEDKALKLYEIFKDADGLDRVRIGDLNIKYLRREYSKTLVDEAKQLYNSYKFPDASTKEGKDFFEKFLKNVKELLLTKEATKENLGIEKYYFFKALLLSKINDNNTIYNSEIEDSKCKSNNEYFKSIISDVNNIDSKPPNNINNLKDHIMWLKHNTDSEVKIEGDSINIITGYSKQRLPIYPVKQNNYHLFHGTSIKNGKRIIEDGYIKATEMFKFLADYNKVFLSNSTRYASLYGMSGGSNYIEKILKENSEDFNEYSIVFQINTSKYDVYHYCTTGLDCEEYFIWDNISVKDIEKCYLMRYCDIVKEIKML